MKEAFGLAKSRPAIAHDFMPTVKVNRTYGRQLTGGVAATLDRIRGGEQKTPTELRGIARDSTRVTQQSDKTLQESNELSEDGGNTCMFLDDDSFSVEVSGNAEEEIVVEGSKAVPHLGNPFQDYMRKAVANYMPFTKQQGTAIKLLIRLRKRKGSLDTYEDVMEWHFLENGDMTARHSLAQCPAYYSRAKVFNLLRLRYNMSPEYYGIITALSLPHSKAKVNIVRMM